MRRLKPRSKWSLAVLVVLVLCGAVVGLVPGSSDAVPIATTKVPSLSVELVTVSNGWVIVKLGQFPQGGNPGDPLLPYKLVRVVVAPDTDLETVQAELVSGDWEELPGEHEIAPAPPAATWDGNKSILDWGTKDESLIINGRDLAVYGNNAYFPADAVEVVSVGQFRQWKVVEYRVWLATYNPVSKKVCLLKNASAVISARKLSAASLNSAAHSAAGAAKFGAQLSAEVANPQDVPACSGPTEGAPGLIAADYVIITTNTIVGSSTKLAAFITAKQTAGYSVKTVTEAAAADDTHYISGGTCNQRADNIRAWLQSHYSGDGTEYVLLIGNPHPTTWSVTTSIPMKMCWPRSGAGSYEDAPSDMYFAELSNTWNLDGDGRYGEYNGDYGAGGCDKFCEVKLGRIPFYGSYPDLDAILQKSIDYGNAAGNLAWRSKVLIPAAVSNFGPQDNNGDGDASDPGDYPNSGFRTFGADWGDSVKSNASLSGFSSYTLYERTGVYADGSAYPLNACDAALNNANFISEWQNYYGFVTWWAHGSQTSASRFCWTSDSIYVGITGNYNPHLETSWYPLVSTADCASLDDAHPSFVVQVSCLNAYPENSGNLGYRLLKQGAIATISGTRVTWYAIGSWNTGFGASVGDNASYGYYCFDRMGSNSETAGTALNYCRSNFGTAWGGSSWMNMVEFSIYGDPSLSLAAAGAQPNLKWEQLPDETENGIDIRCDRIDGGPQVILADDYNCTKTGPITDVTFWGSWKYDDKGKIKKLHLSIHSDDPSGQGGSDPDNTYSMPDQLLWQRNFSASDINETLYKQEGDPEWWWDPANSQNLIQACDYQIWQYDIVIDDSNWFVQQGDACSPVIYWLDIYVELDDYNYPGTEFGWKTSLEHWNDDAVWSNDDGATWNDLHYPPGHPYFPDTIDLSFRIITSVLEEEPNYAKPLAPHTKWSQPPIEIDPCSDVPTYCGWDEESHNKDYVHDPCMWKIVADDFHCLGTMPITSVHWWGSFFDWEWTGEPEQLPPVLPEKWWIAFWSNVPEFTPPHDLSYSHPDILLHEITIDASRVEWEIAGSDEYYGEYPTDICFQYYVDLRPEEIFWQNDFNETTVDDIYWISIVAEYNDLDQPSYKWGWKTRLWHWMDDAVTFNLPSKPTEGSSIQEPEDIEPIVDMVWGDSMDMAFELNTDPNYIKWEQLYTGIRHWRHYEDVNSMFDERYPDEEQIVADDWRCLRRTPVTAIGWWGSYIGYRSQACSAGPFMPLPVKPDYFRLKIWTDVPASGTASDGQAGATDAQISQIREQAASATVNVPAGLQRTNLGKAALSAKAISSAKPSRSLPVRRTVGKASAPAIASSLSALSASSASITSSSAVVGEPLGGGDTCATATVIGTLPFSDTGNTCSFVDDYSPGCAAVGSSDVVYEYTPASGTTVDISLCGSIYDTALYVYENACSPPEIACNDDYCGFQSELIGVSLTGGNTYYIIVDGYGGDCGDYIIDVTEGVPPPPPPNCPPDTLFGQPVHMPSDLSWIAINSDANSGFLVYENFSGVVGEICDIHFWGLDAYWDGIGWSECDEDPMTFEIKFYQNDPCGQPGTEVCSYTIPITRMATGLQYSGFDLWEYSTTLQPCCSLTNGWVSIQGVSIDNPDCLFLWMSSGTGDGLSYQWDGATLVQRVEDLSLCLTGGEVPPGPNCPPGTLFGQPVSVPTDPSWIAFNSDANSGFLVYENFLGVGDDICDIHFWGLDAYYDLAFGWSECDEDPMTFEIKFYQDASGQPGTEVCSYTIPITRTATGLQYLGFDLWEYSATLQPCCALTNGWVSIQGVSIDDPDCWFLWMSSETGDGLSYQWDGITTPVPNIEDLSLCLTSDGAPPTFSHPGDIIWEYNAYEYDEVLVGYDKHPHGGTPGGPAVAEIRKQAMSEPVDVPDGLQKTNMGEELPVIFTGHVLSTDKVSAGACSSILYCPSDVDDAAYRAAISAACGGSTVDYYDARVGTPGVALLSTYDCVYTWANAPYANNVAMGDNLADYVDAGGKVVLGVFCTFTSGNYLAGRIMTSGYCPVTSPTGGNHYSVSAYAGDGTTCIHNGVTFYDSWARDYLVLQGSGIQDGSYLDGEIAQAYRPDFKVIYNNGHSSTVGMGIPGTGQWPEIVCNSCCCAAEISGHEPVFRYSVRLPEEEWFHQPDYNGVFWLSVQAVYEIEEPLYPWGWTNHEHVFNDNAVRRYKEPTAGDWVWEELYDQTDKSEDMSFILFTDPHECSTCANYNTDWIINCIDYADFADDWYWTGPAGGYNNSDLNCDGVADNNDLKIFALQWLTYCP